MEIAVPDLKRLEAAICRSMCADVRVFPTEEGRLLIETPFVLPDGDTYAIYLERLASGGFRITDAGLTLMHMSYTMDLDALKEGKRSELMREILSGSPVSEGQGELYLDTSMEDLGRQLFVFGQTIARLHDLTLWKRLRVASTFMDDLAEVLKEVVPSAAEIHRDYIVPEVTKAEDYRVDFFIKPIVPKPPLYVFGISSKDRAQLATIVLQHLAIHAPPFESLLVFHDVTAIPGPHLARLLNVGGETVASLEAKEELAKKVLRKVAA